MRSLGATGSSISSRHTFIEGEAINLDEVDDDNDDGLMFNEDDNYKLLDCIALLMLGIDYRTHYFDSSMFFILIMAIKYRICVYFVKHERII